MFENFLIKKYSDNPNQYRSFIEIFRKKTFQEGNESISYKKYDPDDQNIETWMVFNENNDLISISAGGQGVGNGFCAYIVPHSCPIFSLYAT